MRVPIEAWVVLFLGGVLATNGCARAHGDTAAEGMRTHMQREALRTQPDYVVYIPGSHDYSTGDSGNEHFLVFDGPDGSLMAVWTQAVGMRRGHCNRIVFARSNDDGKTWSAPKHLAGPQSVDDPENIASWGFPLVSKSGRVYVVWNQNQGVGGRVFFHTGTMAGRYSDDHGASWSEPQDIPLPRSPYDDPDGKIPGEWIVWQIPMRDQSGGYLVGYTRWVNEKVAHYNKHQLPGGWVWMESVVEFMRFENVDKDPDPKDLKISFSAWGEQALRVPHYLDPLLSIAQEPSIVRLPDERLLCAMRTNSGTIWYSLSNDDGRTWCNPRPLLRKDKGRPILQPVACCPIYRLLDGRYVLVHHNNPGDRTSGATHGPRRPCFLALGEYRPNAEQPIWFSQSKQFLDTGGIGPNGKAFPLGNIGVYTSFTARGGENILWYPDRKCFLLGKRITDGFLRSLRVPE